jgi:hypothetical protein
LQCIPTAHPYKANTEGRGDIDVQCAFPLRDDHRAFFTSDRETARTFLVWDGRLREATPREDDILREWDDKEYFLEQEDVEFLWEKEVEE